MRQVEKTLQLPFCKWGKCSKRRSLIVSVNNQCIVSSTHSFSIHSFNKYFCGIYHVSQLSLVAHSCPTRRPHELQHARPHCPSPTPGAHPNPCPLSWWCHPTISSSPFPFFSCLQSFPASGSFHMRKFFTSGGQSIGVSASTSVLPMNIQD